MAITGGEKIDDADLTTYPLIMPSPASTASTGSLSSGAEKILTLSNTVSNGYTKIGYSSIAISNTNIILRAITDEKITVRNVASSAQSGTVTVKFL